MRQQFILLTLCVLTAVTARAQTTPVNPSISGYSPVSYFTENKAERGNAQFSVVHEEQLFYLTSAEQVALFTADPERYRPRHTTCPYSLALGMVRPIDPTNFKIVADSLLLFHRSDDKDALLEWNASELSEQELLERADANVFLIKF